MINKVTLVFFSLVFNLWKESILAQSTQSLRFAEKDDTCNVINVNCGAREDPAGGADIPRNPGPPGKTGPIGPAGPQGMKGEKGIHGHKGEAGKDPNVEEMKADLLAALSAATCNELLSRFGINKTGHYLMRKEGTDTPKYIFCDFDTYEGTSSCEDLWARGKYETGYYRFSEGGDVSSFVHCIHYYTCDQLQKHNGTKLSGVYMMSPGLDQYRVHCTFSSGTAITEVWHSSMQEVKASPECESSGCYSWTPQYEISGRSILKIIENSQECRQFIKARCKGMILFRNPHAWWVSRQGDKMTYWGGATSRRDKYCACGESGSCQDKQYKCNCDWNNANSIVEDEGFLTDKSKLPVQEIRLSDMGDPSEKGWHTLGKLECMG